MESQSNSFSDATGRYAKSIFQIAVEKNILPEIEKNFFQVGTLLKDLSILKSLSLIPLFRNNLDYQLLKLYQKNLILINILSIFLNL